MSTTGKKLQGNLKKRINHNLSKLLELIESKDEINFNRAFYINSAQLKADIEHYKDLTKAKSELKIVELALFEEETLL